MRQERKPSQPPQEIRMGSDVPMEAIAQILKSLPIPITIERRTLEKSRRGRTHYYAYQVGTPTPENPVGICMGGTPDFLEAVKFSLEAVMGRQQQKVEGQGKRRAQSRQRTQARADEWIVPEVERGESSDTQAAALGLPYRHRITGETIAEWIERTGRQRNIP